MLTGIKRCSYAEYSMKDERNIRGSKWVVDSRWDFIWDFIIEASHMVLMYLWEFSCSSGRWEEYV